MKKLIPAGLILLSMACLTACGGTTARTKDFNVASDGLSGVMSESYMAEPANVMTNADSSSYVDYEDSYEGSVAEVVMNNPMIAKDVNMSVDAKSLEDFDSWLNARVEEYKGYFEQSEVNNYDSPYSTSRYAYYTFRIPADQLDSFLTSVETLTDSSVTSRSISREDVSLQYVDIEAHINALQNEKENLLRLMDNAEEVADMISIEERLSAVQAELDSYKSQKQVLEGRVSYSKVTMNVKEERLVEHPIQKAFEINFKERALEGIEQAADTFVGIIVSIPVIIIVTAFVIIFLWILSKLLRLIFRRKDGMNVRYTITPVVYRESDEAVSSTEPRSKS